MNLDDLKRKSAVFEQLIDELQEIKNLQDELDFMEKDIEKEEPDHFFGFCWVKDGSVYNRTAQREFALNGGTQYTSLTRSIIALTRADTNKRKVEIEAEINENYGG